MAEYNGPPLKGYISNTDTPPVEGATAQSTLPNLGEINSTESSGDGVLSSVVPCMRQGMMSAFDIIMNEVHFQEHLVMADLRFLGRVGNRLRKNYWDGPEAASNWTALLTSVGASAATGALEGAEVGALATVETGPGTLVGASGGALGNGLLQGGVALAKGLAPTIIGAIPEDEHMGNEAQTRADLTLGILDFSHSLGELEGAATAAERVGPKVALALWGHGRSIYDVLHPLGEMNSHDGTPTRR